MNLNYHIGTFNTENNNSIFTKSDKIDLFEDESIMYRGKLVDSENIEAIFNDLVNTFTVPASPKNNRIFKNWFEMGVKDGFNPNLRVDSFLEYNTLQFRTGKTQLEEIRNKDGKINSYSITFYGEVTGLEDLFTLKDNEGNDLGEQAKLKDLDFSAYNFTFNERNITALFTTPSLVLTESLSVVPSLIMPMIVPADRKIEYNTGTTEDESDITLDEGRLFVEDLRPAIRQTAIIEAIEEQYGITFSRDFIDSTDFTTLYTWLNGNPDGSNVFKWESLEASAYAGDEYLTFNGDDINLNMTGANLADEIGSESVNESYEINFEHKFKYKFPNDIFFKIRIVDREDNILHTSELTQGRGTTNPNIGDNGFFEIIFNTQFNMVPNSNDVIDQTFRVEIQINKEINTADGNEYYSDMITTWKLPGTSGDGTQINDASALGGVRVIEEILPTFTVSRNMPDITILDYLKNLIKEFKLIIRPNSTTNFRLQNINDYYAEGNIIDITKYVDEDSEESSVYKNNKKISYNYSVEEDSDLQLNFKENTGRFRGNDIKNFPVDNKKTTEIELETEIPFFVRLKNTDTNRPSNINIAIYNKVDGNKIDKIFPENMLSFYYNGLTPITNAETVKPIKLDLNPKEEEDEGQGKGQGTNIIDIFGVPICDSSNNYVESQVSNNLDFSDTTINGWHQTSLLKNIYNQNHKPWINNLLNSDARITSMDSILPPSIVNNIDLNSQIIYKNNKYSIEDFEIDLTTNESNFRLFPNFNNQYLVTGTTVSPTQINFNAGGGFSNIVVRTDKDIESISENSSWITLGEISGNRRVFNVPVFVSENYINSQRNASITLVIGGQTYVVNINQASRVGSLNNTQLTISPTSRVLAQVGQEFTVDVQSNGFWTIGELPDYITLLSDELNFGNGVIRLSITENDTEEERNDSFIVFPLTQQSFRTFSFTQEAEPFIEVLTEDLDVSSGSQNFTVEVATNSDVTPTTFIEETFITETSSTVITGGYRFTFTITENPSTTENRDSLITFRIGNFFTSYYTDSLLITQSDAVPFITVIPSNVNLDFDNNSYIYEVDSNVSWTVTKDVSWITLNTTNGNGDSNNVSITLDDNLGSQRQGIVTVRNNTNNIEDTLVVNQLEYDQPNPPPTGRPQGQVTYLDNGDRIDISWLASNPEYGTIANYIVQRSLNFGAFENVSTTSNLFFTDFDIVGGGQYKYRVIAVDNLGQQSVANLISLNIVVDRKVIIRPNNSSVSNQSGSNSIDVISNTAWSASGNNFLSIPTADQTGSGNKEIDYIYSANTDNTRTGVVTVEANVGNSSDTHNVTQAAFTPTLSLIPTSASLPQFNPNNISVNVASNSSWIVSAAPSWFTVIGGSDTGNGSFIIDADTNNSGSSRSATLQVEANVGSPNNTITRNFNVSQIGVSDTLVINPENKTVSKSDQNYNITIESNTAWTVFRDVNWIDIDVFSGSGNDNLEVRVLNNSSNTTRVADITFSTGNLTEIHTVTQAGVNPNDLFEYLVAVGFDESNACNTNPSISVWSESSNFGGSQVLYSNSTGSLRVNSGFYSREGIVLETNSNGEVINSDLC